jgi:hypothetical protein
MNRAMRGRSQSAVAGFLFALGMVPAGEATEATRQCKTFVIVGAAVAGRA